MKCELLDKFVLDGGWRDIDDENDSELNAAERADVGSDVASQHNASAQSFRYLQTLIAGEGVALPHAGPYVKIVTSKDGWKEEFALVYGFPAQGSEYSAYATRFPQEAEIFKIYYGANYGPGGYGEVETAQGLDAETEGRLKSGDFTDEEAERILAESGRLIDMYWRLNVAARDPELNPEYADRVNAAFYRNAAEAGL